MQEEGKVIYCGLIGQLVLTISIITQVIIKNSAR